MVKSLKSIIVCFSEVPLNGQMGPSGRSQMSQTPMARHPSREQLIDYLMLKVSHQPQGPPRIPQDTLLQEVSNGVCFHIALMPLDWRSYHVLASCQSMFLFVVGGTSTVSQASKTPGAWLLAGFKRSAGKLCNKNWLSMYKWVMNVRGCISDPCESGKESRAGFQYIRRRGRPGKSLSPRW